MSSVNAEREPKTVVMGVHHVLVALSGTEHWEAGTAPLSTSHQWLTLCSPSCLTSTAKGETKTETTVLFFLEISAPTVHDTSCHIFLNASPTASWFVNSWV